MSNINGVAAGTETTTEDLIDIRISFQRFLEPLIYSQFSQTYNFGLCSSTVSTNNGD